MFNNSDEDILMGKATQEIKKILDIDDALGDMESLEKEFRDKVDGKSFSKVFNPDGSFSGYVGYGFYIRSLSLVRINGRYNRRFDVYKMSNCGVSPIPNAKKGFSFIKPQARYRERMFCSFEDAKKYCVLEYIRCKAVD